MSYRRVALLVTVSSILMPAIVIAAQGQLASDLCKIQFGDNGITSLKRVKDVHDTEYITPGGALGNLVIRFKSPGDANWRVASEAKLTGPPALGSNAVDYWIGALDPTLAASSVKSSSSNNVTQALDALSDGRVPAPGGRGVLDYALHFAKDPTKYLRLGYASSLSAWALVNSGTAESGYGYWNPGKENDGAAGGGFVPEAWGRGWIGKQMARGAWYYSAEEDIGYCGAPLARGYCLAAATAAAGAVPRSPELPQSCAPEPKESSRGQAKRRPRFTVAGERALKGRKKILCMLARIYM